MARLLNLPRWLLVAAGLLVIAGLPWLGISSYLIFLMTGVYMFVAWTSSLNIISGYTGRADFGNVAFFGLGAYTTGILMGLGWGQFPAMLVAGGVGGAYALLLGWPLLRLRGHYFAIATIGVLGLTRELPLNWTSLTGGGGGLSLPLFEGGMQGFILHNYYVMAGLATAYVAISALVLRSRFGYALRAIRADEDAARMLGIRTTLLKMSAWGLSAALTAIVGGAFAYRSTYLTPQSAFSIVTMIKVFVMMLLGGAGSVAGPVIGAAVLEVVATVAWQSSLNYSFGVLGLVIVLVVVFVPRGLVGWARQGFRPSALLENVRQNRV